MCRWYQSFKCPLVSLVPQVCLFVWLCLRFSGWVGSVHGCPFGSGFVRVGLGLFLHLPLAAWLSAVSYLCSSVRLGFLLAEAVS